MQCQCFAFPIVITADKLILIALLGLEHLLRNRIIGMPCYDFITQITAPKVLFFLDVFI